ncbi:MAG: glycosyltransferase family 4 protein, partial [bacterium]|nr:glycosyltransferase family 4 protein [bacterium]
RKVNKLIADFAPDIIHIMEGSYASILPFLKTGKAKTFITIHGTYSVTPVLFKNFFKKAISSYLSDKYYKKVDGIVSVSNYTKNHLLRYYPWLEPKIKVITNGINLEENQLIDLRQKPENRTKQILFVGAIKKRKGILEAVEACRYYLDNFSPDFIYNLVGSYDPRSFYYQEAFKKIKEYNLEDRIFFRGRVDDEELKNYYLNADLYLMLSLNVDNNFEGFGLVFLEANAKGVPCIGSSNSGCQEAIAEGKTGFTVNPLDYKEAAQKMNLILNKNAINPEDCLDWASQNDIKIKARELINFYESTLRFPKD